MTVVATGNVSDRPFGRTIYTIAAKRFSGDLVLMSEGQQYKISWQEGLAVAAQSSAPSDTTARIALASGLIDNSQVSEFLATAAQQRDRDETELLIEVASLQEEAAASLKQRILEHRSLRIFAFEAATFQLDNESTLLLDLSVQPLHAGWMTYHGTKAHYDVARLIRELDMATGGRPMKLKDEGLQASSHFRLDPIAQQLVQRLAQTPTTVTELRQQFSDKMKVELAALYTLLMFDCLQPAGSAPNAIEVSAETGHEATAPRMAKQQAAVTSPDANSESEPQRPVQKDTSKPHHSGVSDIENLVREKLALVDNGANYFELLGIDENTGDAQVQLIYLKLAKKLHPDRLRAMRLHELGQKAENVFAHINEAFGVIGDKKKRADYLHSLTNDSDDDAGSEAALKILQAEESFQLGMMSLRRSQWDAALEAFERALALNPDEGEHHALRAWALWCNSQDKQAVAKDVRRGLNKAIALSPRSAVAYLYRGQIAKQQDQLDTARECFSKVLEFEPNHRDAILELRLLNSRGGGPEPRKSGIFDRLRKR